MAKITVRVDTETGKVASANIAIIPQKLIFELNEDGTYKRGLIQYRLKANNEIIGKVFSMGLGQDYAKLGVENMVVNAIKLVAAGESVKSTVNIKAEEVAMTAKQLEEAIKPVDEKEIPK